MNHFSTIAFLRISAAIGGINLCIGTAPLIAAETSQNFQLKHGISINIPRNWRILESKRTEQMNANSGKVAGINQGDNEILIAANLDNTKSGNATATARVSVRTKKTNSQAEVQAMTQETLDAWAEQEGKMVAAALIKSGSDVRVTPFRMTKEKLSGFIAIRSDYQQIGPSGKSNVSIYAVFLGARSVKITLSYDESQAPTAQPAINEIKNSIHITP